MSIGTTAWLPSMLTCTLQAHYIAHETTPYCPTIPNHRLNGTVYVRQAGVTPRAATCNFVARKVTPQHRSHIPYLCAAQRPPAISIQFAARQMVASPRRFFINIQPNVYSTTVFANGFLNRNVAHANASQLRKGKRRRVEDLSYSH